MWSEVWVWDKGMGMGVVGGHGLGLGKGMVGGHGKDSRVWVWSEAWLGDKGKGKE